MNKPTLQQIEAVAEWWAVRTFDHVINQNNGDDSFHGRLAMTLKTQLAHIDRNKGNGDARDKFKECIIKQLELNPSQIFYCDYDPNKPLRAACDYAGIGYNALPIKSHTQLDGDKFIGKYQYGGKFETIA